MYIPTVTIPEAYSIAIWINDVRLCTSMCRDWNIGARPHRAHDDHRSGWTNTKRKSALHDPTDTVGHRAILSGAAQDSGFCTGVATHFLV